MQAARPSAHRTAARSMMVVGTGLAVIGVVSVYSFASTLPTSARTSTVGSSSESTLESGPSAPSTPAPRRPAQPQEIGAVIILAGIDADSLAAAGFSGADCDRVFDAASVYCLQSDRITDFSLAHKALNEAKARSVKPPVQGQGELPTVEQAHGSLNDLRDAAFTFLTAGLDADNIVKLRKIRTNKEVWHLPAPYLTVDRTDTQWLALRGALAAQRFAIRKGTELAEGPAAVIAAADQTIVAAKSDYASNLPSVRQSWDGHSR